MYVMAQLIREKYPETEIDIYYMDVRVFSKGYEEYYERSQKQYNIRFIRGRPAEIVEDPETKNSIVRAEDTLLGDVVEREYDLVALSGYGAA